MATVAKAAQRSERKILVFLATLVVLFILMAIMGTWTPRLGLDLRGGTTVTLTAKDAAGGQVNQESLNTAASIISNRVDSLGVGESAVTVQGDSQIQVSVPNIDGDELVNLVGSTARLNFRGVIAAEQGEQLPESQRVDDQPVQTEPSTEPSVEESGAPKASDDQSGEPAPAASTGQRRPAPALPTDPPTDWTPRPTTEAGEMPPLEQRINYQPTEQDIAEFQAFKCGMEFPDVADQPLIACDEQSIKYLLTPVLVSGENLDDAQAGIPQQQFQWVVTLDLDAEGTSDFAAVTKELSTKQPPANQFAIVLDNQVLMAPSVNEEIPGGQAQISGDGINEESANAMASTLRYGALPIDLEVSSVDTISPTLGGEQLQAGIIAGGIGLLLVLVYSFIYYRGLSVIVAGSLLAVGAMMYAIMVLLGGVVGFALNLPGIAGFIVGIGMTADSFIVYFERIRDEVREGYTLRHAIESGWQKARNTILMADGVQLLAAVVLYFLSIGSVKGFAFTLGITTAVDLFLIVFFTHPLLSLFGRTKFFGEGHKWSGFSAQHMGVSQQSLVGRRTRRSTKRKRTKSKSSAEKRSQSAPKSLLTTKTAAATKKSTDGSESVATKSDTEKASDTGKSIDSPDASDTGKESAE